MANPVRAINDRAALEALLERGPLTRPELGTLTGLSKPTASQLLDRLGAAGLVLRDGVRSGGLGRTAELYRLNPHAAHVAGVDATPGALAVEIADLTGKVIGSSSLTTRGLGPVAEVRAAVERACEVAEVELSGLGRVVIGVQGALNPATGRLGFAAHLPGWHLPDLVGALTTGLGIPVEVENDVNLVALAEQAHGVAGGKADFVLLWAADGIGMAVVVGGRLQRGATGGAGEIGYLQVPGAPSRKDQPEPGRYGLHALVGGDAIVKLMRDHGFRARTPGRAVQLAEMALQDRAAAVAPDRAVAARAALTEVAEPLAAALAAVLAVIDPGLVVLAGDALRGGGEHLRALIESELNQLSIPQPEVRLSTIEANPVVTGALQLGLKAVRDEVFGSSVS